MAEAISLRGQVQAAFDAEKSESETNIAGPPLAVELQEEDV